MEKVIDVRSGEFPSLAGNEDFALVFRGLAMGGAINASIIAGDDATTISDRIAENSR